MINSDKARSAERESQIRSWLAEVDALPGASLELASGDASFRRYFRLQKGSKSFIVMDAPPPMEDCRPFVAVAGYLKAMSLNAPRVVAKDLDRGFLLLTDLGDTQYLDQLKRDSACADSLYEDALSALLTLQRSGAPYQAKLPPYDETLLRTELSLFRDWLCGQHLGLELSDEEDVAYQRCCDVLVNNALQQPRVFVHRDFHSRNLMVVPNDNPGILDFQDAVAGPITYDLVSLLKDCYIRWPNDRVEAWAFGFYRNLDASHRRNMSAAEFLESFTMMGVQRHLKAAGIFCRLYHRDGKAGYLNDVPEVLNYLLDATAQVKPLKALRQLIEERVLPQWESVS